MTIQERLMAACNGHPNASIPWPHRLLHDASGEIDRLRAINADMLAALQDGARQLEIAAAALERIGSYDWRPTKRTADALRAAIARATQEG